MGTIAILLFIPFVMWIIQKVLKKTGPKANYLRRRVFAWSCVIWFLPSLLGALVFILEIIDMQRNPYRLIQTLIQDLIIWGWIFFNGFKSGNDGKENRGFFFAIWEAYKPEYVLMKKQPFSFSD
tara:strand:- start:160 stop:531 length:372 start_codon:yes stop_codon:yes gene_type:complete